MTFALGFDFRIGDVEILALKIETLTLEKFKNLISSIKSFRNCDYYKFYLLIKKIQIKINP